MTPREFGALCDRYTDAQELLNARAGIKSTRPQSAAASLIETERAARILETEKTAKKTG